MEWECLVLCVCFIFNSCSASKSRKSIVDAVVVVVVVVVDDDDAAVAAVVVAPVVAVVAAAAIVDVVFVRNPKNWKQ